MPTHKVVLTAHQTDFVEELVASGRYQTASEVLGEGLRLIEKRETENALRLTALRKAAHSGIDDFEVGNFLSFASQDALDRHLAAIASASLDK